MHPGQINRARIQNTVKTLKWISQIRIVDEAKSTNALLMADAIAGAEDGTVLVTEVQSSGRGRRGRQWVSEAYQDLALSILIRPQIPPEKYPILSFCVGMAIFDALEDICGNSLKLKWPNDLLLGNKKLAGMLAESVPPTANNPGAVVIGVGINVNSTGSSLEPEVRANATSLALHKQNQIDRTDILEKILQALDNHREDMKTGRFETEEWNRKAAWIGEEIVVTEDGRKRRGTFEGVQPDGSMRLREESGIERTIICGDVVRRT